jgi:hypothetical protein
MLIKYCASCGGKTEYTIKLPLFCGACGQSFIKAFTQNKVSKEVVLPTSKSMASSIPKTKTRTRPIREDSEDGESSENDSYNESEVQEMARELAASISADDFIIQGDRSKGIKIEDMLNPNKKIDVGQRTSE